jgi:hypothetical protein
MPVFTSRAVRPSVRSQLPMMTMRPRTRSRARTSDARRRVAIISAAYDPPPDFLPMVCQELAPPSAGADCASTSSNFVSSMRSARNSTRNIRLNQFAGTVIPTALFQQIDALTQVWHFCLMCLARCSRSFSRGTAATAGVKS